MEVVGIALQSRDRGGGASPLEELRSSRVRFARTSKLFEFLKLASIAPRSLTASRAPFLRTSGAHAPVLAPSVLKLLPGRQSHSRTVALRNIALAPSVLKLCSSKPDGFSNSRPADGRSPEHRTPRQPLFAPNGARTPVSHLRCSHDSSSELSRPPDSRSPNGDSPTVHCTVIFFLF